MTEITKNITIDVAKNNIMDFVLAKQGDKASRFLEIELQNNGEKIEVLQTSKVYLNAEKPDKTITKTSGKVLENGKLRVGLTNQTLACDGQVICDVSVENEDSVLTSLKFNIKVEACTAGDDVIASTDEFTDLDEMVTRVDELETTVISNESERVKNETARQEAEVERVKENEIVKEVIGGFVGTVPLVTSSTPGAVKAAGDIEVKNPGVVTIPALKTKVELFNNAGAHNGLYRGKYLGASVTSAQYAMISAGTFDDLFIGDYWTIGGVNYRIAAFDYWLNGGNPACTAHHVVIVPDTCLYNAEMNTGVSTSGGYANSLMRTSKLTQAKTTIKSAFSGHVLNHKEAFSTVTSSSGVTDWEWFDSEIEIMGEVMLYGSIAWGRARYGSGDNVLMANGRFPLFSLRQDLVRIKTGYWLRDVCSDIHFCLVGSEGNAGYSNANASVGVRPTFAIY